MSRSSSTTRMSSAINRTPMSLQLRSFGGLAAGSHGHRLAGETQDRARAAAWCRSKGEIAAMLLDDLLDDRESEASALLARRHVGLEDAHPTLRQADAVVGYADRELPLVGSDLDFDSSAVIGSGLAPLRLDRFGCVLEHVGHRLAELVAI